MTFRPQGSVPQFHEEILRIRSQGTSEFPRGEETYFYHIILSSRNQVPPQELGLHLVEVPSLLIAQQLWTDSCIVLTWIQGPLTNWKKSVGNRVAIIQDETASAMWRHVPTHSNPADLISRGIEPTTLSTATLWWKGPQWLTKEPSS